MRPAFIYSHGSECSFIQLSRFLRPPDRSHDKWGAYSYLIVRPLSYQRWVWNTISALKPRVTVPNMEDVCELIDLASTSQIPRDIFLSAASVFGQAVGPGIHWTVSQDPKWLEAAGIEPFNIDMAESWEVTNSDERMEISWRMKWIFSTSVIRCISAQILFNLTEGGCMNQESRTWQIHATTASISKRAALFWIVWTPLLNSTSNTTMSDQVTLWDCLFRYFARHDVNHHPLRILWLLSCCPYDLCDLGRRSLFPPSQYRSCDLGRRDLFSPSQYRFDFFHTADGADDPAVAHSLWFISSALKTPSGPFILKEILKISQWVYHSYSPYEQSEDEFIIGTDVSDKDTLKKLSATFLDSLERRWPGLCPCNDFNMAKVHRYRHYSSFLGKSGIAEGWAPPECFSKGAVCPGGRFWCDADLKFYCTIPRPTHRDGELWSQPGQSVVVKPSTPNSPVVPTETPFEHQHNAMDYGKPDSRRQGDNPARGRGPFVQISVFIYALGVALGAMAVLVMFEKSS